MPGGDDPYYRAALAKIHHEGFGFHADACAPGILAHLAPIRERGRAGASRSGAAAACSPSTSPTPATA